MPRATQLLSPIRTACKRASTFSAPSYSVENCPIRSFAKNHSEAARLVLEPPPLSFDDSRSLRSPPFHLGRINHNHRNHGQETLEDYLKWRRWDVKIQKILDEHRLGDDLFASAVGLLSHPLTFPLTLGRHIHHFVPPPSKQRHGNGRRSYRICCVGARSECTLPEDYWREFLIMTMARGLLDNPKEGTAWNPSSDLMFEWIIDFVGPDVPTQMKSKSISLFNDSELHSTPQYSLTMNYHTWFLHDLILQILKESHGRETTNSPPNIHRLQAIQQHWDGFVLFNPGLGHPNLANQWESTFKFLCKTDRPILLTAHSPNDAHRDRMMIEKICEMMPMGMGFDGYQVNPYASRMEFIDPFQTGDDDLVHVVQPNHSVLLL